MLEDIIKKNSLKIKQIIKNITGNYSEDLEQEVYIKVHKNFTKYKELGKFSQWISKITANTAKDYLRSSIFKNKSSTISQENIIENIIENIRSKETPEKILLKKERQKYIFRAIEELPKKLKQTIILYEFENKTYEEISKKLKIPEGTVKSRINSARRILKEKLSYFLDEED